jgi:hypothetical protein
MNAFIDFGERQLTAPARRRLKAAEQRARNKALRERGQLFALWYKHHRKQRDVLLAGQYGDAARRLLDFLRAMTLECGQQLIELVDNGPWRNADTDTRFVVLQLIDGGIARLRERHGLAPFDDALPFSDEPETAFQIIRRGFGCD